MKVLVTGGAGFIGSAVIRQLMKEGVDHVVNLDKLTYAASLNSLAEVENNPAYRFIRADICDASAVAAILDAQHPDAVMHLAAESHVDRSIDGPAAFVNTNIIGTSVLLQAVLGYFEGLSADAQDNFRFHHVSTDEVFGSLGETGTFSEKTPYDPRSPYSASKASSDHLVRAWHHTYGLPVVLSNCSNNYGPYQFPEKLIPLMIISALEGRALPVYGKGENIRDWVYVEDHAEALVTILRQGHVGDTYLVGGNAERRNIDVVRIICNVMDELLTASHHRPHADLISFVEDRPGHDLRYAIDFSTIRDKLGWAPRLTFEEGIKKTVAWYISNRNWWQPFASESHAGKRLGLINPGLANKEVI